MVNLSRIPIFGFETINCNANRARLKHLARSPEGKLQLRSMNSEKKKNLVEQARKISNAIKVLAYMPIAGMIIGISGLHLCLNAELEPRLKACLVFRRSMEILNLGLLLLIPDLIANAVRAATKRP